MLGVGGVSAAIIVLSRYSALATNCRFIGITISRRLDYIGKLRGFAASGVRPMPILMVMISDKDISGGAAVFVKTPGAPAIPLLSNIWLSLPTPASVSYVSALR